MMEPSPHPAPGKTTKERTSAAAPTAGTRRLPRLQEHEQELRALHTAEQVPLYELEQAVDVRQLTSSSHGTGGSAEKAMHALYPTTAWTSSQWIPAPRARPLLSCSKRPLRPLPPRPLHNKKPLLLLPRPSPPPHTADWSLDPAEAFWEQGIHECLDERRDDPEAVMEYC
jgi:hypothetical protein